MKDKTELLLNEDVTNDFEEYEIQFFEQKLLIDTKVSL